MKNREQVTEGFAPQFNTLEWITDGAQIKPALLAWPATRTDPRRRLLGTCAALLLRPGLAHNAQIGIKVVARIDALFAIEREIKTSAHSTGPQQASGRGAGKLVARAAASVSPSGIFHVWLARKSLSFRVTIW